MRQKPDSHRRNSICYLPTSPPIYIDIYPERVEAYELNHYALNSLHLLEEEQPLPENFKKMPAWPVRSTVIQTRERTAMRSVQVSTIHTVSIVINRQDITSITNLFLKRDSIKSTLNL